MFYQIHFIQQRYFGSLFNNINSAIASTTAGTSCKINSLIKSLCHELLLLYCSGPALQHRNPAGRGGLNISKTIRNISQHSPCLSDSDCEGEQIENKFIFLRSDLLVSLSNSLARINKLRLKVLFQFR